MLTCSRFFIHVRVLINQPLTLEALLAERNESEMNNDLLRVGKKLSLIL